MSRRHSEHSNKAASVGGSRPLDPELEELKQRLHATESQLQQERKRLKVCVEFDIYSRGITLAKIFAIF